MRISGMMLIGVLVAAAGMTGCSNSVKTKNARLQQDLADLENQLADRNAALESCHQELQSREQQLAQLRRDMETGTTGFENIPGVTGSVSAGEVTASVEGDLLFDSGKTTLKSQAKKSLDAMASVLNSNYSGMPIRIAGHTDTDPIKKSGYKSNYHLAFERAYAVREYLMTKGVDGKRLSLSSYGPNEPGPTKAQSRRVEAVVLVNQ